MNAGDLVRFPYIGKNLTNQFDTPIHKIDAVPCIVVGLLVEYHTWEKIANVLFNGQIHRIHVQHVELHKRL